MPTIEDMNKALVNIFHITAAFNGGTIEAHDAISRIQCLAEDAIPTTAQILVAMDRERALKAKLEVLERLWLKHRGLLRCDERRADYLELQSVLGFTDILDVDNPTPHVLVGALGHRTRNNNKQNERLV